MVEIFDLVSIERKIYASYPRRSIYQNLKPYGLGTGFVESLTSYVGRLAYKHNVKPQFIIEDVISSQVRKGGGRKRTYSHRCNASLNGIFFFIKWFVQGLEYMTCNKNLKLLTMLTFEYILHSKGIFKETRAWCPDCYNEMFNAHGEVYDPLIWFFEQVNFCPKHNRPLLTKCPYIDCQSKQRTFNRYSNVHCQKCNRWLGTSDATYTKLQMMKKEKEWQSWINQNIGELLIVAPNIEPPSIGKVFHMINECFEKQFKCNGDLFYGYMGMEFLSLCTMDRWRTKIYLDELLKFSYCTGVGLEELFTKDKIGWDGREVRYPV
ncbi:TniQ family protein [Bacillus paranthracis]|uniref:TniQ family protein n=1 Tax=Bacillus paranthracis TaxID=2026186 RepID=UPI00187AA8A3|nr:TniQ family protein [Bacillus paranthracis]MBE7114038.1 TniQ family protein [Bacillus paranthracis]MBE7133222.1 TniQ family protein [Bacillus paranthracis]MBE7154160.1 TniQ family protein [Bacillus paranthracis]MDK7539115.1 TniQ family protein [Bacillus paranthracis]MDK7562900.1 TniQ family protein [Bacillus paranthracis]